jgi:quercetin dioxygenase-like cupin family protein
MEIKYNEATLNRPEGDRVLDAPFVFTDFQNYIRQLKQEDAWQKSDRNSITVFKNNQMTVVLICLHQGATIENNSIDGLLSIQVLEGKIRMEIETEEIEIMKHQLMTLHQYVNHSMEAAEDSVVLLTNYVTSYKKDGL